MSNSVTITVQGIAETGRLLEGAPREIVAGGFLRALEAGGNVIESEIWRRTPIDLKAAQNAAHGGKGPLFGKLDQAIEVDSRGRGGSNDIGFGPLGHIALWVEYGHRMVTHKPGKKQVGFVPARPFMRPGLEAAAERAVDAFAESLRGTVEGMYEQKTA